MPKGVNYRDFDWFLLLIALRIAAIGVAEIYSTTAHTPLASQYKRQIYWILLGCVSALIVSRVDYHVILEHVPWIYLAGVMGLLGVLFAGQSISGARRWLRLGP